MRFKLWGILFFLACACSVHAEETGKDLLQNKTASIRVVPVFKDSFGNKGTKVGASFDLLGKHVSKAPLNDANTYIAHTNAGLLDGTLSASADFVGSRHQISRYALKGPTLGFGIVALELEKKVTEIKRVEVESLELPQDIKNDLTKLKQLKNESNDKPFNELNRELGIRIENFILNETSKYGQAFKRNPTNEYELLATDFDLTDERVISGTFLYQLSPTEIEPKPSGRKYELGVSAQPIALNDATANFTEIGISSGIGVSYRSDIFKMNLFSWCLQGNLNLSLGKNQIGPIKYSGQGAAELAACIAAKLGKGFSIDADANYLRTIIPQEVNGRFLSDSYQKVEAEVGLTKQIDSNLAVTAGVETRWNTVHPKDDTSQTKNPRKDNSSYGGFLRVAY